MKPIQHSNSRHAYRREASYMSLQPLTNDESCGSLSWDGSIAPIRRKGTEDGATEGRQSERQHSPDDLAKLRRRGGLLFDWWLEAAACFGSVALLLALFATLYFYEDRPSPHWPSWVSLNAIVSIYIASLKSTVLLVAAQGIGQLKWNWFGKGNRPLSDLVTFDDASRGPSGAVVLLWKLRARHLLSSCGALIIILALAVDTFVQQSIHYYECSVPMSNAVASLPRTNYYWEPGAVYDGSEPNIVPGAQSAINGGVFSAAGPPPAHCSTGNCTWPSEYSTIGWCSSCKDITSWLTFKNHTSKKHIDNYTIASRTYSTSIPGSVSCETLYNGETLVYAGIGLLSGAFEIYSNAIFSVDVDFVLAKNYGGPLNPSTGKPWSGCDSAPANKSWTCQGYGASRCSLSPCIKTYLATVDAGTISEILVNTSFQFGYGDSVNALTTVDTLCIDADERQSLEALGYNIEPDQRWLVYNTSWSSKLQLANRTHANAGFPQSMVDRGCLYAVDGGFANSLQTHFDSFFTGKITGPTIDAGMPLDIFHGPQVAQAMFNFGNVTFDRVNEMFANISQSLTNYIRQNGAAGLSAPAVGVTKQEKACVGVHWLWLAFPTFLVFLTLTFFGLIVFTTWPTGNQPAVWKSSPLVLLYHGLEGEDGVTPPVTDASTVDDVKGMEKLAKSTTVRLRQNHHDVARLRVEDSSSE